jgi:hypothetical protein
MTLKAKVRYPRIDIERSEASIHETMVAAITDAARSFVVHATPSVPVLTGASKASFLKLASLVQVSLTISPRVESRIPLGIATSTGVLTSDKDKGIYGFEWSSELPYIHIVDARTGFVDAGIAGLESKNPILPQPTIKRS